MGVERQRDGWVGEQTGDDMCMIAIFNLRSTFHDTRKQCYPVMVGRRVVPVQLFRPR